MVWLHHLPEREQYKQQLYGCFDFDAMRDNELSQVSEGGDRLVRPLWWWQWEW
jgi:hypothetical protein